jgi:gamma-glutamylcysteine synthetase
LPVLAGQCTVGEEMGIGFLGLGFQTKWALSDIPIMPKVILSFNLVNLITYIC